MDNRGNTPEEYEVEQIDEPAYGVLLVIVGAGIFLGFAFFIAIIAAMAA